MRHWGVILSLWGWGGVLLPRATDDRCVGEQRGGTLALSTLLLSRPALRCSCQCLSSLVPEPTGVQGGRMETFTLLFACL